MALACFTRACVCVCVCPCVKEAGQKTHSAVSLVELVGQTAVLMSGSRSIRQLFSLNSCLSTSLIKTRGRGEEIKPANENAPRLIPPAASGDGESRAAGTLHPPAEGAVRQHMSEARVCVCVCVCVCVRQIVRKKTVTSIF